MTAPARTCANVKPGHTEPCGLPADDEHGGGQIDACPACRDAADAILWAHVRILTARAAEIEASRKAA